VLQTGHPEIWASTAGTGRFLPVTIVPAHRQLSGAKETLGGNLPKSNFDRQLSPVAVIQTTRKTVE